MLNNRRLGRIFRPSGRALIVAMDHGLLDGPCRGLEDPAETIAKVVAGGADAVRMYLDYVKGDFRKAMLMTGCDKLDEITKDILVKNLPS